MFNIKKNLDFLAIGDTTTDAFIKLKEAEVHCDVNKDNCTISMKFADKIPYDESIIVPAVGNSANASVCAKRLGLHSGLLTNLGDDSYGKEDLEILKKEGVDVSLVKTHEGKKSNYHFVLLYNGDRTILINHEEYDYSLPDIGKPKWIYLSSLAPNSLPFHLEIAEYLKKNPDVRLAFQPGTYQMKEGAKNLSDIYKHSEIFFCNVEEALRILEIKDEKNDDRKILVGSLLERVHALGPKMVVITDGPKGAYAYDNNDYFYIEAYPDPAPPLDRTGAGDAFAGTIVAGLALGLPLREVLPWGPINSMSVVQYIGAREGLLTKEKIEEYLKSAPETYKVLKI